MPFALRLDLRERFARWALRTCPPESVPIKLTQRRIYVLPTRAGILFALSLLVMLIGAINYNLSLGYGLVFLLTGLGVASILHTFRNLAGLSIGIGRCDPVFAGETARFPLYLANQDQRERRLIRTSIPGHENVLADVPPDGSCRILLPMPATKRGWLMLPRVTLESVWPLGLVRAWGYAAPALACLVYPKPVHDAPPVPAGGGMQGGRTTSDTGDEDFAGLRRHQPSDPPHHVAWKTVARLGHEAPMQTKQFAGTASPALWLDWASLPREMDVELKLSVLTRWVLDAEAAGLSWGLRLPGRQIAQAHGSAHLHACLTALALHGKNT